MENSWLFRSTFPKPWQGNTFLAFRIVIWIWNIFQHFELTIIFRKIYCSPFSVSYISVFRLICLFKLHRIQIIYFAWYHLPIFGTCVNVRYVYPHLKCIWSFSIFIIKHYICANEKLQYKRHSIIQSIFETHILVGAMYSRSCYDWNGIRENKLR